MLRGWPYPVSPSRQPARRAKKQPLTDNEGRFTLPFLTPGPYPVHAELQGFTSVDRTDVQVRLGQTVEIPITMQVGALSETVQVNGTPPTLDTSSATIG